MFIKVHKGEVRTAGWVDDGKGQVVAAQKGTWASFTTVNPADGPNLPHSTSPMGAGDFAGPKIDHPTRLFAYNMAADVVPHE